MKVSDLQNLEDGMPVKEVEVTVKWVGKRRTGSGQHGEYSYQDMGCFDDSGEVIVSCSGKEEMEGYKGARIKLGAFKSDKHGWVGLTVFDDTYEDKTTRKLKLTSTGKMEVVGAPTTASPPSNTNKDSSICRQTAGKVVAELHHGSGKEFDKLIGELAKWESWFMYGLPPEEVTTIEPF